MDISHAFARVVVSGNVVEVYKYRNPIPCGRTRDYEIVRDKNREEEGGEKRMDNLYSSFDLGESGTTYKVLDVDLCRDYACFEKGS